MGTQLLYITITWGHNYCTLQLHENTTAVHYKFTDTTTVYCKYTRTQLLYIENTRGHNFCAAHSRRNIITAQLTIGGHNYKILQVTDLFGFLDLTSI